MKTCSIILFLLASIVKCLAAVQGDDFNANTTTSLTVLQQWYNSDGLWNSTGWWNAANCIDAVENGIVADNGQSYLSILSNTFDLNSGDDFINSYYDDEGWWTEAWIKAYDLTGNIAYLDMAKTIFSDVTNGWDTECGGGVWWDKTHTYKNAIPNELFLLNAIRLHQRTPGDAGTNSYFFWATNEWTWFSNSGMINSQNLINDGLTSNCVNNGETTWTYNQGVILGGLVDLYKVTGNTNYLSRAETLANAATSKLVSDLGVLQEPCEVESGCSGGDVPEFKGIFVRHLTYLYDVDHKAAYFNFLYTNAHSVWFNDRNTSNQLGLKWTGPFDTNDAARQSSAIMPVSALAEPSTVLLPFARGSGDPSFNHNIGQAAGTLAWSCNPVTNAKAGTMQNGPYLTSLPVGAHVVHFRLAVSAVSNSATNLVQLIVSNQNVVAASNSVPWNSFAQANQPQDFPLSFTNTVATNALQFAVYWNAAPSAPTLTISDITTDGSHNWTAANLAHNIGRLDGLNAWEADPVRDTASGYLTLGPGTPELLAGPYTAKFELKVDNFNWDNSIVATLSVVDTDSGSVVASQSVARTQFPNTLYQVFLVNFQAVAGAHYDFRVYWNYAANAPRLAQRSVVVAPSGSSAFVPVPLAAGSYNQDMVIEHTAPADPAGAYTTASMDAGVANTGNGWYERGYNASAPSTGLPPAGSTMTNASASDHVYTLASSYGSANVAMVDSTHTATLTPASATAFSALSFLTAAGHGPVIFDYTVHHADGSTETGTIVDPDWFNNTPVAFDASGRVDVVSGSFNSVNTSNPNLYVEDITLTNTASQVTRINLNWDSGNTGSGVAAIFALSGVLPAEPPFGVAVTPSSQTQYVGATASFSVTASGTPPFTYQWESNGAAMGGATNASLVLSNLTTSAAATYSCVVNNNIGSLASAGATLAVLLLPLINAVYSGGELTLTWSGNALLLQATNVGGPWLTNAAAASPYQTNVSVPAMFYRLQAN